MKKKLINSVLVYYLCQCLMQIFILGNSKDTSIDSGCNGSGSSMKDSPFDMSPSYISPRSSPKISYDKENMHIQYFSPSHSMFMARPRKSPLKEVQNTIRSLIFSPSKKRHVTPKKNSYNGKCSPIDDFDTNSQDSGFSESNKKESAVKLEK